MHSRTPPEYPLCVPPRGDPETQGSPTAFTAVPPNTPSLTERRKKKEREQGDGSAHKKIRTMARGGERGGPQVPHRPGRKRKPAPVTLAEWQGPTPQRLRHAGDAGMIMTIDAWRTDAGEETELRRLRIVNPLEQLWKAGVLDSGQYGAARRYQRDADLAAVVGPGACVRYKPRMIEDGGGRDLMPIEAAVDHLKRLALAQAACGPKLRPMLDWMAAEPLGWRQQAAAWWPQASERSLRREFIRRLRIACDGLERHYRARLTQAPS